MMFWTGLLLGFAIGCIGAWTFLGFIMHRVTKEKVKIDEPLRRYWQLSVENQTEQVLAIKEIARHLKENT